MSETQKQAAQTNVTAALLALGRPLNLASLLLTVSALLTLVLSSPVSLTVLPCGALLLAVFAGLAEYVYALRTAFDQPIFADWSRRWQHSDATPEDDLAAFDQALIDSGLRGQRAENSASTARLRPLTDRIAGARRLLRRQGYCLGLQVAGWLLAVIVFLGNYV